MNLIKCHIENFGRLSNVDFDFTKGVNSILEENGWGKTTLATFIRCMFYGLAGSRKKEYIENERAQYQPWNDGFFGGEITFEVSGKTYIIRRNFGKKDKDA
ncbi:MAG: AAA family ATPase, partial [Eubacterium sp.]|nr:AAA family ATPase [Eubacterium sp.]